MRQFAQLSLAVLLAASQIRPAASPAYAQQADNRVSLNFVDTDIPAVLRALSLFTQRNFLVDPRVRASSRWSRTVRWTATRPCPC